MMENLTTSVFATAISAVLFAGAVSAAGSSIYGGFADGNPDLYPRDDSIRSHSMVTASAPGVGDSHNHYQGGWARGNSDLFHSKQGAPGRSEFPDIYHGFADNPDL